MTTFHVEPLPPSPVGSAPASGFVECAHPDLISRRAAYATCPACGEFTRCRPDSGAGWFGALWAEIHADAEERCEDETADAVAAAEREARQEGRADCCDDVNEWLDDILSDTRAEMASEDSADVLRTLIETLDQRGWG